MAEQFRKLTLDDDQKLQWTEWVHVMSLDSIKSEQQPISSEVVNPPVEPHDFVKRTSPHVGYRMHSEDIEKKFVKASGLFEIGTTTKQQPKNKIPSYLGRSESVTNYINKYCSNGSNRPVCINKALKAGKYIWFRATKDDDGSADPTKWSQIKKEARRKVDYPWKKSDELVQQTPQDAVEKLEKIDVEGKFKVFVSKVRDYWSGRDVEVLKGLSLQDANTGKGVSYSDELLEKIEKADSVKAFFSILEENPTHYSWINTQVLEKIAPSKEWYTDYVSAISPKPLVEVLDAIPTALQIDEKAYTIVKDNWERDVDVTTVGQLFDHMLTIASILKIERSSFFVTGISKGCIKLVLAFLTNLGTVKFAILAVAAAGAVIGTVATVMYNGGSLVLNTGGLQILPRPNQ